MIDVEFEVETSEPTPTPAVEVQEKPEAKPAEPKPEEPAEAQPAEGEEAPEGGEQKPEEPAWKAQKKGPPETVPYNVFSESRAEIRALKERLEAFEQRQAQPAQQQQQPAPAQQVDGLPPKPKMEEFQTYEAYEAAKDDWLVQAGEARALARIQQEQAARQNQAQMQELERTTQTFRERLDTAQAADPEVGQIRAYLAPVFDALHPGVQEVIAKADDPAVLLRALAGIGRNHEELVHKVNSNPAEALMYLGRHMAAPAKAGAPAPALPVIPPTRTVAARGAKNETPIDAIARKRGFEFE